MPQQRIELLQYESQKVPSLQLNFTSERPSLMFSLQKSPNNFSAAAHEQAVLQNFRDLNNASQPSGKRNTQSVEGMKTMKDPYTSLDRNSSKKQYLDSAKRESNFIKVPQVASESKVLKKPGSSLDNDDSSERLRKATLSPPPKDSSTKSSSVTKQGHKVLAQTLSKTKKISYIKQLVKKS